MPFGIFWEKAHDELIATLGAAKPPDTDAVFVVRLRGRFPSPQPDRPPFSTSLIVTRSTGTEVTSVQIPDGQAQVPYDVLPDYPDS